MYLNTKYISDMEHFPKADNKHVICFKSIEYMLP